jgi:hypothetical protein
MSFEGTIRSDGEVRHTIRHGVELELEKDECQAKLKGGIPGS